MQNATALTRDGKLNEATLALRTALSRSVVSGKIPETSDFPKPPAAPFQYRDEHSANPPAEQKEFTYGEFTHAGVSIPYRLYIPSTEVIGPMPLLLLLHGCTQDATDFATGTAMNTVADENGIAVLYPSQTASANANKCWNWFEPAHQRRGAGEPAALSALTQQVISEHALDSHRVFVAGMSAGGAMSVVLGEQYPELFAAVGIHSGLPSGIASNVMQALSAMKGHGDPVERQRPPSFKQGTAHPESVRIQPTIVFHGARDRTVDATNAQAIVDDCLKRASEVGENITSQCHQTASGVNAVTITTHRGSAQQVICEYWHLHSAGHQWSGGNPAGTHTDASGPNASAEMVRFFLTNVDANVL
ncbi:PHB depolymerase family esterase [Granulosicoccus sp.]|nr:PHB depolymerase family esterase [Granulosicoccus sp.]